MIALRIPTQELCMGKIQRSLEQIWSQGEIAFSLIQPCNISYVTLAKEISMRASRASGRQCCLSVTPPLQHR